jgi:hypothetical protein
VSPDVVSGDDHASATDTRVARLIRVSLATWRIAATVTPEIGNARVVCTIIVDGASAIAIARAPPGIPFRWMVTSGERQRPASSVAGLLRVLRSTIDPDWRTGRARVVPLSLPGR